jgi:hypothetical protein
MPGGASWAAFLSLQQGVHPSSLRDRITRSQPTPRPSLQFVVVEWEAVTVCGENQHPGGDQLLADLGGRSGLPGLESDACGLGEDVGAAISVWRSSSMDSSRLRRSAAYRKAVPMHSAEQELIRSGHARAYRIQALHICLTAVDA